MSDKFKLELLNGNRQNKLKMCVYIYIYIYKTLF